MAVTNPGIARGVLNRVRCSVVVPSDPTLNITAPNMGRQMARLQFEGQLVNQIPTATGLVNSPEPYAICSITIALLRTQPVAAAWLAVIQNNSNIKNVTIHSDTSQFPEISLQDVVVSRIDPGPFDATNPDVQIVLKGAMPVNNNLWSYA